jgi:NAD-dependent DNA ligase
MNEEKFTSITIENKNFWDLETPATIYSFNKEANLVGLLCICIKSLEVFYKPTTIGWSVFTGGSKSVGIPEGSVLFITEQRLKDRKIKVSYEQSTHWISTNDVILIHVVDVLKQAKFAFTGELTLNRDCYKQIIAIKGGKTSSTVTKNCDYLVVGHRNGSGNPTTKLKMANSLGIKILDEKKLNNLLLGKE